jgi:hypothetical protein
LWEGSGRVKFYRVYHIDAKGGTTGLTNFTTSNDDLACEQARAILARSKWPGIEVWELGRQVHCGGLRSLPQGRRIFRRKRSGSSTRTRGGAFFAIFGVGPPDLSRRVFFFDHPRT